jgi:hypothetical protein
MSLNHIPSAGSPGTSRYYLTGVNPIKWNVDYPLLGLDLQVASGAATSGLFWQTVGALVTGAPLTGVSTFNLTGTSLGRIVGGRPRKYRAFLVYAAYTPSGSVASTVTVTIGKDVKTYTVDLRLTSGMGAATVANISN